MSYEIITGPERLMGPPGEDYMKLQCALDKLQKVNWLRDLAKWEVMATLTFRWESSLASAQRMFEKMMRKTLPGVSYAMAIEKNPSRDGYHVHALWADCKGVYRKRVWENWKRRYGRARIEPVKSVDDASGYAAKYLCKADSWFDVRLQWHWIQRLRGPGFALETPPPFSQAGVKKIAPGATSSEISDKKGQKS